MFLSEHVGVPQKRTYTINPLNTKINAYLIVNELISYRVVKALLSRL